jgi:hypothetical protein
LILHDYGLRKQIGGGRLRPDLIADETLRLRIARVRGGATGALEQAGEKLAFFR